MATIAHPSVSLGCKEALERLHNANEKAIVHNERLRYLHEASKLSILDNYVDGKLSLLYEVEARLQIDDIGGFWKSLTPEAGQ
jgi:hypothetical protein